MKFQNSYKVNINSKKELDEIYEMLQTALENPIFLEVKNKYKNVLEVKLNESFFFRAPSSKGLYMRRLPMQEGDATIALRAISNFERTLEKPEIDREKIRKFIMTLEEIMKLTKFKSKIAAEKISEIQKVIDKLQDRVANAVNPKHIESLKLDIDFHKKDLEMYQQIDGTVQIRAFDAVSKAYFYITQLILFVYQKRNYVENLLKSRQKESDYKKKDKETQEKIKSVYQDKIDDLNTTNNYLLNLRYELNKRKDEVRPGFSAELRMKTREELQKKQAEMEKLEKETSEFEERIKDSKRGIFGRVLKKLGLAEQAGLSTEDLDLVFINEDSDISNPVDIEIVKRWQKLAGIKV